MSVIRLPALTRDLTDAGRERMAEFVVGFLFGIIGPVFVAGMAWGYWSVPSSAMAGRSAAAAVDAPGAAVAAPLGSGAVRVSWTASPSTIPGAHHVVTRTSGPGAPVVVCAVPLSTTACTDTALVPGYDYTYSVAAQASSWRSTTRGAMAATPIPVLEVVPASNRGQAGSAVGVTVRAMLGGAVDTTYTGTRALTWSGLSAAPDGRKPVYPSATAEFVAGVASPGSAISFRRGAAVLQAADAAQPFAVGSASLDVAPAPVADIQLSAQPASVVAASSAAAGPFTVMLHDVYGNDVPAASATQVSLAASSPSALLASSSGGPSVTSILVPVGQSIASFWFGDTLAGQAQVTASAAGVTVALPRFDVAPGPASRVAVTSAQLNGQASSSATLGPVVASVQDAFGNAVAAPAGGRALSLSSSSAGAVFAATSGGVSITALTVPAGSSSASFFYGDTRSGTPSVTVGSSGLTSAVQAQTVAPAAASRLAFTTTAHSGPSALAATLGPITVQRQDPFGNAVPVASGTVAVSVSSSSTGGVFAGSASGTSISSVPIAAGSSSASFWYGDSRAGTPTLTASATGLTSATQAQAVGPARLVITSAAVSGNASATPVLGPITVQQQDASGAAVVAGPGGVAVALSSATTGTAVFGATSGGSPITSVTIPAGSSSASFFYGDTRAAAVTITAASGALASATQSATVSAASASRLTFTSSAVSTAASASATSGPITVSLTDAFGNTVPVQNGGGLSVSLSSSSTGTAVFAATSGGSSITSVTIPKSSTGASFYYGDNRAGSPVITAAASSLTSGTQTQTVNAAAPSRLVVTSSAVPGAASSTAAAGPVVVGLQDSFGNTATAGAGGVAVTPTSSSAGTVVFAASSGGASASTVTIPAGSQSASLWFGDTRAGTPTLTFSATGLAGASQAQTVTAAAASQLVITSSATSGVASSSAVQGPIAAALRDAFGNTAVAPLGGTALALSSSTTGTGVFAATSGGTSVTSVTIAAGSSSASFFYGDTRAGSPTLSVSATGLTAATQAQTVTAASPSRLVITSSAVSGSAATSATLGAITVQRQDSFGNAATPGSSTSLTLSSSSSGAAFALASGGTSVTTATIAAGASSASFFYGDSRTGTPTITVAATGLTSATQSATITSSATRVVITGSASGTATSSASLGPITVALQDSLGNAIPAGSATTVSLSSTSTAGVFAATSGGASVASVTIASGSSSATVHYGDTKAGTATITAAVTGLTSGMLSATISAGSASALQVTAGSTSLTASSSAAFGPVTVTQADAFGNAVSNTSGSAITVSLSSSTTGTAVFSATSGGAAVTTATIGTGKSSATFYYGDTKAGSPTITAAATGRTSGTLGLTVSAAAPTRLVFTSAAVSGKSSASATLGPITIGLQDQFGNTATAAASTTVGLASTSANGVFALTSRGTAITSLTIAAGSSSASYYYNSSTAGTWTMTVSSTGLTSATQGVTTT